MTKSHGWFEVDRKGLRNLYAGKPKSFLVRELVQNAWDADGVTTVRIVLGEVNGLMCLTVEDDAPRGFEDIKHAYTIFAPTSKRADPTKRGRFNIGEKQVLALCEHAEVATTSGTIIFNKKGDREAYSQRKREKGSRVSVYLRLTQSEHREIVDAIKTFIPPGDITTYFGPRELDLPRMVGRFATNLATEYADAEGVMRGSCRSADVEVYEPRAGETPTLYEFGLPICATEDRWHYNVLQRVPMSIDRDTVRPSFLRDLRAEVLNRFHEQLTKEEKTESWVHDAMEDERVAPEAVRDVVVAQHGEKTFVPNPSDPQANERAVKAGYHQVSGGAYSKRAWENIRGAGDDVLPSSTTVAGKTTLVNGETVPEDKWTKDMRRLAALARFVARWTINDNISVRFTKCPKADTRAQFGSMTMTFNVSHLSSEWMRGDVTADQLELVIHELGHFEGAGHFDMAYHETLCQIGAQLALIGPKTIRETVRKTMDA